MTNKDKLNELEAMRLQLDILKTKLNSQNIINDQLLHQAMSNKMSWIMKFLWFELVALLPICALCFIGIKFIIPTVTWPPIICILALMLADILFDFYINHTSENDWLSENLIVTSHKLVRMKRLRFMQVAVSLPVAIALFTWHFSTYADAPFFREYVIGGIAGGVIGFAIGFSILLKMNRTNDELIRQIKDLTKDNI